MNEQFDRDPKEAHAADLYLALCLALIGVIASIWMAICHAI